MAQPTLVDTIEAISAIYDANPAPAAASIAAQTSAGIPQKSDFGFVRKAIKGGTESLQGTYHHFNAAISGFVGAEQNEFEQAQYAQNHMMYADMYRQANDVKDFKDLYNSEFNFTDWFKFLAHAGLEELPSVAATFATGGTAMLARFGNNAVRNFFARNANRVLLDDKVALAGKLAILAHEYTQGVGESYARTGQAGPALITGAITAPITAATEIFVARALVREALGTASEGAVKSYFKSVMRNAGLGLGMEAGTETLQTTIQQYSQYVTDPNYDWNDFAGDDAYLERIESALVGGTVGGVLAGGGSAFASAIGMAGQSIDREIAKFRAPSASETPVDETLNIDVYESLNPDGRTVRKIDREIRELESRMGQSDLADEQKNALGQELGKLQKERSDLIAALQAEQEQFGVGTELYNRRVKTTRVVPEKSKKGSYTKTVNWSLKDIDNQIDKANKEKKPVGHLYKIKRNIKAELREQIKKAAKSDVRNNVEDAEKQKANLDKLRQIYGETLQDLKAKIAADPEGDYSSIQTQLGNIQAELEAAEKTEATFKKNAREVRPKLLETQQKLLDELNKPIETTDDPTSRAAKIAALNETNSLFNRASMTLGEDRVDLPDLTDPETMSIEQIDAEIETNKKYLDENTASKGATNFLLEARKNRNEILKLARKQKLQPATGFGGVVTDNEGRTQGVVLESDDQTQTSDQDLNAKYPYVETEWETPEYAEYKESAQRLMIPLSYVLSKDVDGEFSDEAFRDIENEFLQKDANTNHMKIGFNELDPALLPNMSMEELQTAWSTNELGLIVENKPDRVEVRRVIGRGNIRQKNREHLANEFRRRELIVGWEKISDPNYEEPVTLYMIDQNDFYNTLTWSSDPSRVHVNARTKMERSFSAEYLRTHTKRGMEDTDFVFSTVGEATSGVQTPAYANGFEGTKVLPKIIGFKDESPEINRLRKEKLAIINEQFPDRTVEDNKELEEKLTRQRLAVNLLLKKLSEKYGRTNFDANEIIVNEEGQKAPSVEAIKNMADEVANDLGQTSDELFNPDTGLPFADFDDMLGEVGFNIGEMSTPTVIYQRGMGPLTLTSLQLDAWHKNKELTKPPGQERGIATYPTAASALGFYSEKKAWDNQTKDKEGNPKKGNGQLTPEEVAAGTYNDAKPASGYANLVEKRLKERDADIKLLAKQLQMAAEGKAGRLSQLRTLEGFLQEKEREEKALIDRGQALLLEIEKPLVVGDQEQQQSNLKALRDVSRRLKQLRKDRYSSLSDTLINKNETTAPKKNLAYYQALAEEEIRRDIKLNFRIVEWGDGFLIEELTDSLPAAQAERVKNIARGSLGQRGSKGGKFEVRAPKAFDTISSNANTSRKARIVSDGKKVHKATHTPIKNEDRTSLKQGLGFYDRDNNFHFLSIRQLANEGIRRLGFNERPEKATNEQLQLVGLAESIQLLLNQGYRLARNNGGVSLAYAKNNDKEAANQLGDKAWGDKEIFVGKNKKAKKLSNAWFQLNFQNRKATPLEPDLTNMPQPTDPEFQTSSSRDRMETNTLESDPGIDMIAYFQSVYSWIEANYGFMKEKVGNNKPGIQRPPILLYPNLDTVVQPFPSYSVVVEEVSEQLTGASNENIAGVEMTPRVSNVDNILFVDSPYSRQELTPRQKIEVNKEILRKIDIIQEELNDPDIETSVEAELKARFEIIELQKKMQSLMPEMTDIARFREAIEADEGGKEPSQLMEQNDDRRTFANERSKQDQELNNAQLRRKVEPRYGENFNALDGTDKKVKFVGLDINANLLHLLAQKIMRSLKMGRSKVLVLDMTGVKELLARDDLDGFLRYDLEQIEKSGSIGQQVTRFPRLRSKEFSGKTALRDYGIVFVDSGRIAKLKAFEVSDSALNKQLAQMFTGYTLSHEMGHQLFEDNWRSMADAQRTEVQTIFENEDPSVKQWYREAYQQYYPDQAFKEWFADRVAAFSVENIATEDTNVEAFTSGWSEGLVNVFKKIAAGLKHIFSMWKEYFTGRSPLDNRPMHSNEQFNSWLNQWRNKAVAETNARENQFSVVPPNPPSRGITEPNTNFQAMPSGLNEPTLITPEPAWIIAARENGIDPRQIYEEGFTNPETGEVVSPAHGPGSYDTYLSDHASLFIEQSLNHASYWGDNVVTNNFNVWANRPKNKFQLQRTLRDFQKTGVKGALGRVFFSAEAQLSEMGPAGRRLAKMFYKRSNTPGPNGFLQNALNEHQRWTGRLNNLLPKDKEEAKQRLEQYFNWKDGGPSSRPINATQLDKFFEGLGRYLKQANPNVDLIDGYVPHLYDPEAIKEPAKATALARLLVQKQGLSEEDAVKQVKNFQKKILLQEHAPSNDTLSANSEKKREWDQLTYGELKTAGVLLDPMVLITKYVRDVTRAAEFNKKFGMERNGKWESGALIDNEMMQIPVADRKDARYIVDGMLGKLGNNLSPEMTRAQSWVQTVMFVATLMFATVASLPDVMMPTLRSKEFGALGTNIKTIVKLIGKESRQALYDEAYSLGTISTDMMQDSITAGYGIEFMDPKARKVSETFFKYIGLDYWTRMSRVVSTSMGREFLLKQANRPNARSARYLEELGVDAQTVQTWNANGQDYSTPEGEKVADAIRNFTEESMLRPNAAERPTYMSDPKWLLIGQLKGFFYSFGHKVVGGLGREIRSRRKAGENWGQSLEPVALAASAMLPLSALGLAIREEIKYVEGTEPTANMNVPQYMFEIISRAGFLGPMEIVASMFSADEYGLPFWAAPLGPAVGTGYHLAAGEGFEGLWKLAPEINILN